MCLDVPADHDITFRIGRRQLRYSLIATAGLTAVASLSLWGLISFHVSLGSRLGGYWFGLALSALIYGYLTAACATAYTTCTSAGLTTRGLTRRHHAAWADITAISIQSATARGTTSYTSFVTKADGTRFRLGMPVAAGFRPDPDFAAKVNQITERWSASAGGATCHVSTEIWSPRQNWLAAVVALAAILVFAMVAATISTYHSVWDAHFGNGKRGTFIAIVWDCRFGCSWVGTFTAPDGSAKEGMSIAPGWTRYSQQPSTAIEATFPGAAFETPAIDSGNITTVYPPGGGSEWRHVLLLLSIQCSGAIAFFAATLWLGLRRKRRMRRKRALTLHEA